MLVWAQDGRLVDWPGAFRSRAFSSVFGRVTQYIQLLLPSHFIFHLYRWTVWYVLYPNRFTQILQNNFSSDIHYTSEKPECACACLHADQWPLMFSKSSQKVVDIYSRIVSSSTHWGTGPLPLFAAPVAPLPNQFRLTVTWRCSFISDPISNLLLVWSEELQNKHTLLLYIVYIV